MPQCSPPVHATKGPKVQFLFGDYVLDLNRRELTRRSAAIAIGPRVFDLLVYLVKARDRVVTRDELLDTVWSGRIASESTLTSHINAVRKAIGDSGQEQRLIRTIARKASGSWARLRQEAPIAPSSETRSKLTRMSARSRLFLTGPQLPSCRFKT